VLKMAVALALWWLAGASAAWADGIATTVPLSFGRIAAGAGGTVTVAPGGARSASGGVVLVSSGSGTAAQFILTGAGSGTFGITLPANGVVLLTGPNGATMPVNYFSSMPAGTGTLSTGGTQTLNVGATLGVGATQQAGDYSGVFSVIVNFN
jgi:hypothetical protein